jgi:hypothetical protein
MPAIEEASRVFVAPNRTALAVSSFSELHSLRLRELRSRLASAYVFRTYSRKLRVLVIHEFAFRPFVDSCRVFVRRTFGVSTKSAFLGYVVMSRRAHADFEQPPRGKRG